MTAGEIVMASYTLAALALILIAVVYAVHLTQPTREPALPTSLDCLDGKHAGCDVCAGCSCHSAVFA